MKKIKRIKIKIKIKMKMKIIFSYKYEEKCKIFIIYLTLNKLILINISKENRQNMMLQAIKIHLTLRKCQFQMLASIF